MFMRIIRFLFIAFIAVLFVSCRTSRKGSSVDMSGVGHYDTDEETYINVVDRINALPQPPTILTSKISCSLLLQDKKKSIGGTLRMKRDRVIQVSLVALGLLEVARIEITPDYLLFLDRMGKQYVRLPFDEVQDFIDAGLDFYSLQALFWNQLFVPGNQGAKPEERDFEVRRSTTGNKPQLAHAVSSEATLLFDVDAVENRLLQTEVELSAHAEAPILRWTYQEPVKFGRTDFPSRMTIQLNFSGFNAALQFSLNNIKSEDGWETYTQINEKRYKKVEVDDMLKRLSLMNGIEGL